MIIHKILSKTLYSVLLRKRVRILILKGGRTNYSLEKELESCYNDDFQNLQNKQLHDTRRVPKTTVLQLSIAIGLEQLH